MGLIEIKLSKPQQEAVASQNSSGSNEYLQGTMNYNVFMNEYSQEYGFKTTNVEGEANFGHYAGALCDPLKEYIMEENNDNQEADDALKAYVLSNIFSDDNCIDNADFAKECEKLGLTVERELFKSTMIPDNKGRGGNFSTQTEEHSLRVFRISDGKGGEILIVDSNGNGAIEAEEVILDDILEKVAINLDEIGTIGTTGTKMIDNSVFDSSNSDNSENKQEEFQDGKKKLSSYQYNLKLTQETKEQLKKLLKDKGLEDTYENRQSHNFKATTKAKQELDKEYVIA